MACYRIEIDREICASDQLCCSEAPNTFEMDDDDIAVVTQPPVDPPETVLSAAQSCPVDAIFLYDSDTGKKVWPEE